MIHLINMPFASLIHPSLPLGLFKAQLDREGTDSEVFNFNFDFARRIGFGNYSTIAFLRGVETQLGEWLFAQETWGEGFGPSEEEFLSRCGPELDQIAHVDDRAAWLGMVRHDVVPGFLDACLNRLEQYGEPDVVGFSCSFFQTVASLALGQRIKAKYPSAKLVYGGACFHGKMGEEFIQKVPWIDAVSTGEADDVFLPLIDSLLAGRDPVGLQGIHYRDATGQVQPGPPTRPVSFEVFKALPDPDYTSFFRDAARVGLDSDESWRLRVILLFESSRGCWWGQKHHCNFCGLGEHLIRYRIRSAKQVYEQLFRFARRYPEVRHLQATDNILSMQHFRDLLPRLQAAPLPGEPNLFYSVKANMTRAHIKALAEAGIRYVQPGIESLADHPLRLMGKGVTGLQNVFFMKVCREYGITVYWNILIRLPGEQRADYERMADWLPKLYHLRPPYSGAVEVECHRFSPYFEHREQWASDVRPQAWYEGIFPADLLNLDRVAYYFDADWKDVLSRDAYAPVIGVVAEWTRIWYEEPVLPQLRIEGRGAAGTDIVDTRQQNARRWHLDGLESAIYSAIDSPASRRTIQEALAQQSIRVADTHLQSVLDHFVQWGLAVHEAGRYLALALAHGTADPLLETRRQHMKALRGLCNRSSRDFAGEATPVWSKDSIPDEFLRLIPNGCTE
jgi:ribosomal peptide maturation radical SAM protein 1